MKITMSVTERETGAFERMPDAFRNWVRRDASTAWTPDPGRYHLYVSLACPWAHRTLIVRHLKRLESIVSCSVVDPIRTDEEGWAFREGRAFRAIPSMAFPS